MVANLYSLFWFVTIPAFLWLSYQLLRGSSSEADGLPWDLWDILPATILLLPVLFTLFMYLSPLPRAFRLVPRAIAQARWDELLRLAPLRAGPAATSGRTEGASLGRARATGRRFGGMGRMPRSRP